uniref:G protein-coupled receptor 139 n=1 Tax=Myotis myotis TaxID=51298 RepID=A0A7J7XYU4_MYOMY|nr:G protein-coupled receptor 139 [Myotis myotis]
MEHTHAHLAANSSSWSPGSACGLGLLPVVYYSLLLCLGLPDSLFWRKSPEQLWNCVIVFMTKQTADGPPEPLVPRHLFLY